MNVILTLFSELHYSRKNTTTTSVNHMTITSIALSCTMGGPFICVSRNDMSEFYVEKRNWPYVRLREPFRHRACILSKGMIIEPFLEHFSDMDSVEFILLQEKLSHKNRLNSLNVIARM